MNVRKIDIYNHVMPTAVADFILELAPPMSGMVKRVTSIPMLHERSPGRAAQPGRAAHAITHHQESAVAIALPGCGINAA